MCGYFTLGYVNRSFKKWNAFCFVIAYPEKAFSDFTISSGFKMRSLIVTFWKFYFCGVLLAWSNISSAAWWSGSTSGSGLSVILIGGLPNPPWNEMFFRRRGRFPTFKTNRSADFLPSVSSVISLMCQATLLQNKYSGMGRKRRGEGRKK